MAFDEQPCESIYEHELDEEFHRVMLSDVFARHGYDTAKKFGLDEYGQLKAAIVAVSNAKQRLIDSAVMDALETTVGG